MIITEIIMLVVLGIVSGISTITDFKSGLIRNKWIYSTLSVSVLLNIVYYVFFARDLILIYMINVLSSSLLSFLLYGFHFWGAGDSKFLILITTLIPARFYVNSIFPIPTLLLIVFTFSIAFVFLVIEAVVLGIKQKDLFTLSGGKPTLGSVKNVLYGYVSSYAYIVLISMLESVVFKRFVTTGGYIFTILNFFIILTIFGFDILRKWYVIGTVIVVDVVLSIINGGISIKSFVSLQTIALVAIVMLFRGIAEKYNYRTIDTDEIKEGQVLALATVAKFQNSRVKGLPLTTTEDFRSRITLEEVESIKRWKKSKMGTEKIVIVRKLPFAVFISVGTLAFFIIMRLGV